MRLTLVRNICGAFLLLVVALALSCLVAMSVADKSARELAALAGPEVEEDLAHRIVSVVDEIRQGQTIVLLIGGSGFVCGLILMVIGTGQAFRALSRLRKATQQLANVVLEEEIPDAMTASSDDLEREIQEMMRKIKATQQLCLDASPLTRLPGNIAIEQILKGKMSQNEKFALCYIDLDDFKAYNDKYGYAKGSDLIKLTGEIIYRAKDQYAEQDDFVGHIGGDDFVLVTAPEKAEDVCKAIIAEFDQVIPDFYDDEDRARGFIKGVDRYGVERHFPLMSISIAVVSDARREFQSPIEIAEVATEIKDYVKTLPGSNYLIDRRTTARRDA